MERMSFKEDVFAKVITFVTIAVLLGTMLVEAFAIYTERTDREAAQQRLEEAQLHAADLEETVRRMEDEIGELQNFRDNWQDLVILADNDICQLLREDLAGRPELIPEDAVQASILAMKADLPGNDQEEEELEEESSAKAEFSFPGPDEKDWLIPLNLGNQPSVEYLFYARAEYVNRGRYIDLLFEVPVNRQTERPILDEKGQISWKCMAYDAGVGWQILEVEEETSE